MKRSLSIRFYTVLIGYFALLASASASERVSGNLVLDHTKMKTVTAAAPPAVVTLPTCPNGVDLFTVTAFTCPATTVFCTLETNVTTEVSDITPGADNIRIRLAVDGASATVFPEFRFNVNSTAKAGLIESATASWVRPSLQPGNHNVTVNACVADNTAGGGASAFAGDRILTLRVYRGQ
jgi:hypothetical protein